MTTSSSANPPPPSLQYDRLILKSRRRDQLDVDVLAEELVAAVCATYRSVHPGSDLEEVTLPDGFTYVYDATATSTQPPDDVADFRVLCAWGRSRSPGRPRDAARMRGYPSPQRREAAPTDRGHLIAHSMGGGYDINLFPQLAEVNRKGPWRALERYGAERPGTFVFLHLHYADGADRPMWIDFSLVAADGELHTQRFSNSV